MKRYIIDFVTLINTWKYNELRFDSNNELLSNIYNQLNSKNSKNNFNKIKKIKSNTLSDNDIIFLIQGGILEYNDKQFIIKDLWYNFIKKVLEDKFNENIINALDNINFS